MYITIMMIFLLESISAIYFATGCLNNSRLMIESEKKMQIYVHNSFSLESEKVRNCNVPFRKLDCHILLLLNFNGVSSHLSKYTIFLLQICKPKY